MELTCKVSVVYSLLSLKKDPPPPYTKITLISNAIQNNSMPDREYNNAVEEEKLRNLIRRETRTGVELKRI